MPTQQRDTKRNYIGIVDDGVEELRAVTSRAKTDDVVRNFFVAVMSVVTRRPRADDRARVVLGLDRTVKDAG